MPKLTLEFIEFDEIYFTIDGEQRAVTECAVELELTSGIHEITVYNIVNANINLFSALGYKPSVKLLNTITKDRIVNHLIAFKTNYKMCVWNGKIKVHRSGTLQFTAKTIEFDNFLYVKSIRKKIFISCSQDVILYDINTNLMLNNRQKRLLWLVNFVGLLIMCSAIIGYAIYFLYAHYYVYYDKFLTYAWKGKDLLFIDLLILFYGLIKLAYYAIRISNDIKQICEREI